MDICPPNHHQQAVWLSNIANCWNYSSLKYPLNCASYWILQCSVNIFLVKITPSGLSCAEKKATFTGLKEEVRYTVKVITIVNGRTLCQVLDLDTLHNTIIMNCNNLGFKRSR